MIPLPAIYEVKRAIIAIATGTAQDIVAAVTGKKIAVIAYRLATDTEATRVFKSGTTAISGLVLMAAKTSLQESSDYGLFITAVGEKLALTMSATCTAGGELLYCEV